MTVIIFECGTHEEWTRYIDTEGWSLECIETMLRAAHPKGKTVAVVRDADWNVKPESWRYTVDMRYFATSPSWEAYLNRDGRSVLWDKEQDLEDQERRKTALAAFVKLPDTFRYHVLALWEDFLKNNPTNSNGEPRVDEQERLAIIKAAMVDHAYLTKLSWGRT